MFTDLRVGSGLEEENFESYTLIRVHICTAVNFYNIQWKLGIHVTRSLPCWDQEICLLSDHIFCYVSSQ